MINLSEWEMIYNIEDKIKTKTYTHDDVKFLMNLIYKLNGNVIDHRTHKEIQNMIDNLDNN